MTLCYIILQKISANSDTAVSIAEFIILTVNEANSDVINTQDKATYLYSNARLIAENYLMSGDYELSINNYLYSLEVVKPNLEKEVLDNNPLRINIIESLAKIYLGCGMAFAKVNQQEDSIKFLEESFKIYNFLYAETKNVIFQESAKIAQNNIEEVKKMFAKSQPKNLFDRFKKLF